jgi:phosphoribosylanthranilate isomerase
MNQVNSTLQTPQVKICGITSPETALACVRMGADAVGCVFFAKSPRNVSREQAREICSAVAGRTVIVGVFVNEPAEAVVEMMTECGLSCAQLHGVETQDSINLLRNRGFRVIKTLFATRAPYIREASLYRASASLVECGRGTLPGGNAETWNWQAARETDRTKPLILAGGLDPGNVGEAIRAALPDAVDVSSGVEAAPGKKDLDKIDAFLTAVRRCGESYPPGRAIRRIF